MTDLPIAEGEGWRLSWSEHDRGGGLLLFGDGDFGRLDRHEAPPVFALTSRVAWGMVKAHAVAVRIVDERGGESEAPVVGPDLDGRVAFAVGLADGARPARLVAVDRAGAVVHDVALVPVLDDRAEHIGERVIVRPADRDGGRAVGRIVGEGSVGDASWEYGVQRFGDELHRSWQSRSARGGGGGSGGGPMPTLGPGELRIKGTGTSGDIWHLEACGGPSIDRAALLLSTGEVIELPALGRQLDLGLVFFSIGLPADARGAILDALDADGNVIHRVWLAGHLSWLHAALDQGIADRAAASAPLPATVLERWRSVLPDVEPGPDTEVAIDAADVASRWPMRPLLVPPDAVTWTLRAGHHRFPVTQLVGMSLVCRTPTAVVAQSIAWSSQPGTRDEPNIDVRGRPARLEVLTAAVNNIDEISVGWQEPASDIEPFDGIWVSITADPALVTVEQITALAESLTELA